MSALEQREQAFESRDARERDARFMALARRNMSLGLWVAELSGLSGAEARDYARSLMQSRVGSDDDEDIVQAISLELSRAKVEISNHRIRRKITETMAAAVKDAAN
jgi:hypothetical protein